MESVGCYRIKRRRQPSPTNEVYEATGAGGQDRLIIRFLDHVQPMLPATKHACRAELLQVAKLRHPHIGHVVSLDAAPDGVPFVVREHLEGQSLKRYLATRDWVPAAQVVSLVSEVARTLAAAHRVRVIDRSLRPSQVFVHVVGDTVRLGKLLGFSLWRLHNYGAPSHYLAPEQLDGGGDIDGRTDQFALAAIAYRMLSGQQAFPGPTSLAATAGVGPALDAVIQRALARRPADRFAGMLSFATALEAARAGRAIVQSSRSSLDAPLTHP